MNKPKLYLAGKANLDDYRSYVSKSIISKNVDILNPIKIIDHSIPSDLIIDLDLTLIKNSDCILAYIEEYSAGTCMEIFYARKFLNIPVVIICDDSKFEKDIWFEGLNCEFCDSIDKGIALVRNMLFDVNLSTICNIM